MPEYVFSLTRIFPVKDRNLRFCLCAGKYESKKTRILAYFSPILSLDKNIWVRENPHSGILRSNQSVVWKNQRILVKIKLEPGSSV